jgi:hypothetical protein
MDDKNLSSIRILINLLVKPLLMKHKAGLLALSLLVFNTICPGKSHTAMGFIENKGQEKAPVLFKVSGTSQGVYVTNYGLAYVFCVSEPANVPGERADDRKVEWSKLEMQLLGADIRRENIITEHPLPGYSNYYYAHCPEGVLNVHAWQKVTIRSVYPGIDWVLKADEKGMEHDFVVHPGADPSQIKLAYNGATRLSITAGGMLKAITSLKAAFIHMSWEPVRRSVPISSLMAIRFLLHWTTTAVMKLW